MENSNAELLHSQTSVEDGKHDREKSSQLVTNEVVEGTPFRIVGSEETGHAVAIGRTLVTEWQLEQEVRDLLGELSPKVWKMIASIAIVMTEQTLSEMANAARLEMLKEGAVKTDEDFGV